MDLIKHAYIDNDEFVKYLLSSGDWFPGFYRFTMGDRNEEKDQLSISGLIAAYFSGERYTREQWTRHTLHRHTSMDARNKSRSDEGVYQIIDEKYLKWMTQAEVYDIAVFEIDGGPAQIEPYVTYYLMGCMLRFTEDKLLVGYDYLRDEWLLDLDIDFEQVQAYVDRIYGQHVKDFFLPCDVVAALTFDADDVGTLYLTDETLSRFTTSHDNSILYASNRDVSKRIPIRWAKDIILTEVESDS